MPTNEPEKNAAWKRFARRFSSGRRLLLAAVVILAVLVYFAVTAEKDRLQRAREKGKSPPPAVPVVAVRAVQTDFNVYLNGLGTVTPLSTVTLRTRVDGQLMQVLFREGQLVGRGDLLATIDPRPFEVQLTQAEGQMARDRAQLTNARLDLERYRVLWAQDSIPKQQLDTQEALVRQLEGSVKNDQGLIDSARLQLLYCRITSPAGGRIGLRLVDPGNIVHTTDTNGLAVITQLQPIGIIFPIPEDSLPRVLANLRSKTPMPVEAFDRAMQKRLAAGTLLTVDNQIDPTTGTVRLKAVFPNGDNTLFPNQFVNARLLVSVLRGAVVVPAPAIQRGPQGTFVYVVKPEGTAGGTATMRPVRVGEIQTGQAAIAEGLSPGDLVVVDGADRLRQGARVALRGPAKTAPGG